MRTVFLLSVVLFVFACNSSKKLSIQEMRYSKDSRSLFLPSKEIVLSSDCDSFQEKISQEFETLLANIGSLDGAYGEVTFGRNFPVTFVTNDECQVYCISYENVNYFIPFEGQPDSTIGLPFLGYGEHELEKLENMDIFHKERIARKLYCLVVSLNTAMKKD